MILEQIFAYKASWRIIELLSEIPLKPISKKEIRTYTKLGNKSISEAIKRLVVSNILSVKKNKKREMYYLNMGNESVLDILSLIKKERSSLRNISYEYVSVISEFLRKVLDKTSFVTDAYLFGSVAKGNAKTTSDIDICFVVFEKNTKQELEITQNCEELLTRYGRKIQVHYFTKDSFNNSASELIKIIKKEGISLY